MTMRSRWTSPPSGRWIVLVVAATLTGRGFEWAGARALASAGADIAPSEEFLFVARIGALVGGSTARSCTLYVGARGLVQLADEETGGTLHALAEGHGDNRSLLAAGARDMRVSDGQRRPESPQPLSEHYPAKLALITLLPPATYRSASYEAAAAPPGIVDLLLRVEADVQARNLRAAPAGLFGRARRQLDFDAEIETVHATFSIDDLRSLPRLSKLIAEEMSLVRLAAPEEPGILDSGLRVTPGRALRIAVGSVVYLIQAYELGARTPQQKSRCLSSSSPIH